jgi:hypothetical protein
MCLWYSWYDELERFFLFRGSQYTRNTADLALRDVIHCILFYFISDNNECTLFSQRVCMAVLFYNYIREGTSLNLDWNTAYPFRGFSQSNAAIVPLLGHRHFLFNPSHFIHSFIRRHVVHKLTAT